MSVSESEVIGYKEVTVRQVAEAMTVDKTKKVKESLVVRPGILYYPPRGGSVIPTELMSCAMGGAALVLGLAPISLMGALQKVDRDGVPALISTRTDEDEQSSLSEVIAAHNDYSRKSKKSIGQLILTSADEKTLNTVLEVRAENEV